MSDSDCGQDDEDGNLNEDNDAARIKELERRLQSELNLRMGQIGYRFGDDEDDEMGLDEESKGQAASKKKVISKKKSVK